MELKERLGVAGFPAMIFIQGLPGSGKAGRPKTEAGYSKGYRKPVALSVPVFAQ